MRQRVALARTLMEDRPIVLMDEPFAALLMIVIMALALYFSVDILLRRLITWQKEQ